MANNLPPRETIMLGEQPNENAKLANENWVKIRESCSWVINETYIPLWRSEVFDSWRMH
jgi:hypothetical protein